MMWFSIVLLFAVCAAYEDDEDTDLIVLNDDNFEHLTQASSGATTGDWLIMMVKDEEKCSDCSKVEKELKKVATLFKGRMNVAKIDPIKSRLTIRRFKISKKVTLMFFRLGMQWMYKGDMKKKKISDFITDGFMRQQGQVASPPLDSIDVWKDDFIKEVKAAMKERRLPERNALLVLLAALLVAVIILASFSSSKADKKKKKK